MNKIAKGLTIMSVAAILAGGSAFAAPAVKFASTKAHEAVVLEEAAQKDKAPVKLSASKTSKKKIARKKSKKLLEDEETEEERAERLERLRRMREMVPDAK